MPLSAPSSTILEAKLTFAREQQQRNGSIGFFRILLTAGEIAGSLLFPEFAPIIVGAGAASQTGIDLYELNQGDITLGQFALRAIINILPAAAVIRSAYGVSRSVVIIEDARYASGFRYITKAEPGFEAALATTRRGLNPRYNLITRQSLRQQIAARTIDPNRLMTRNLFEQSLQREFGFVYEKGGTLASGRYAAKGSYVFTNKDLSILRSLSRKIYYGKIDKLKYLQEINKLNDEAREVFLTYNASKTLQGQASLYERLAEIGSQLKPMNLKEWSNRVIAGKRGYQITQAVQLLNPNDAGRELLNKPFNKLTRIVKKNVGKWAQELKVAERIAKNKGLKGLAKKTFYINEQLKKNGWIFEDQSFVMGFRTIVPGPAISQIQIFFNPENTNAVTSGSKNFGGKKPVITTLSNAHINMWKTKIANPGNFYLKGGSGFPPIAIHPGGRRAFDGVISSEAFGAFMSWIPLPALRNILSVVSNFKNVGKDVAKGIFLAKWSTVLEDTVVRLLPNKVAKLIGATIGAPFGSAVAARAQQISLGVIKGFQYTNSSTRYINGYKVKRIRTEFSFNRDGGWNPNTLIKNSIPTAVRSTLFRQVPRGYGGNRSISAVGAHYRGVRTATNVRRIPGIFR